VHTHSNAYYTRQYDISVKLFFDARNIKLKYYLPILICYSNGVIFAYKSHHIIIRTYVVTYLLLFIVMISYIGDWSVAIRLPTSDFFIIEKTQHDFIQKRVYIIDSNNYSLRNAPIYLPLCMCVLCMYYFLTTF